MTKALNLDPGEKIILEVRKHWFVFLVPIVALVVGAFLPLIIYAIWDSKLIPQFLHISLSGQNLSITILLYLMWILGLWMNFFLQWTNYYLDVWYVTDKRIIDINQKGIFHREISNLRFDKIQDISVEVKGIIATFLNYGDIRVQTASENSREFFIHNASDPEKAKRLIFSQHHRVAEKHQQVHIVKGEETEQTKN